MSSIIKSGEIAAINHELLPHDDLLQMLHPYLFSLPHGHEQLKIGRVDEESMAKIT